MSWVVGTVESLKHIIYDKWNHLNYLGIISSSCLHVPHIFSTKCFEKFDSNGDKTTYYGFEFEHLSRFNSIEIRGLEVLHSLFELLVTKQRNDSINLFFGRPFVIFSFLPFFNSFVCGIFLRIVVMGYDVPPPEITN